MKRKRAPHGEAAVCDKCGTKANAIPGRRHRRCGGSEGAVREKHAARLARAERGTWRAA